VLLLPDPVADGLALKMVLHMVLLNRKWIPAFLQAVHRVSREDHRR
jgi:hypothetical protein